MKKFTKKSSDVNHDGYCIVSSVKPKRGKKNILHRMAIDFPSSSVTAILGPSGGGKTTLLSVLTDSIHSNIQACAELNLPGESAFVPQQDSLHGFYTVRQYMHHYARLSGLPRNKATAQRIDTLIKQLGLQGQAEIRVGDIFIKGLSGGQKRRLSIALEALTNPNNFFLDEPTSGLDAESALQVMDFLKNYARAGPGRRVILTIHQPSSFIWTMIDHVVLLSQGKLMYQGPRDEIENFFSAAGFPTQHGWNPSDHYVTAVNDEFRDHELSVDEWADLFLDWSEETPQMGLAKQARPSILAASQEGYIKTHRAGCGPGVVIELTYRYFLNLWFNPGILGTRIAMYSMLALMVGALFWELGDRTDYESINSRAAVLFYCVAFFIFMSVAVLPFTVIERAIVDKEVQNNYYHPILYQVSQGLSSIPGAAVLAGLTTGIVVFMTKLQNPEWYFLDMFLSLLVAEALAQLVSHVVPHFVIGMAVIAGMYGFFMLFQGFMLIPSDFPDWLRWTYNVAFHTYSWRTFMDNEFRGRTFDSELFPTGEAVLKAFEIDDVNKTFDMIVLVGYAGVIHLVSFFVLVVKYNFFKGKLAPLDETARSPPPRRAKTNKKPMRNPSPKAFTPAIHELLDDVEVDV
ncbi:Putative white-brown complex homolog protein 30 [Seminavis robusta]|uniref:White-brown complex homolog protein 30 n=1 Tax=Seminavis robusta TaxID=568900 RepID=A0A9N8EGJ1_9STRA|nr:Putative white-brown complex homolog protein 30 [Seminavis robusta]|eukprot:Sro1062_g236970.1 Putative white-brown complex homolog protein 30 (630) ;mRNA; r:19656-21807